MSSLKFFLKCINLLFCFLFLLWGIGLFIFNYEAKHYKLEFKTPADTIAVLTKRNQGIFMASKLLKLGYAPLVYIANNHSRSSYSNYIKAQNILPVQFLFLEDVGSKNAYDAELEDDEDQEANNDYVGNLLHLIKHYRINTIRVIAEDIDLPRLRLEIGNRLPKRVKIIMHPITKKQTSYEAIFIEYNKYLLYYLAQYIGMEDELNLSYS